MITSTMNDVEKTYEAVRVCEWAKTVCDDLWETVIDRFKRGTKFPYFQRCMCEDDRKNKWMFTFLCKTKEDKRKGRYWVLCYTTYEIEKKKDNGTNKYDGNTGKGIIAFEPKGLYNNYVLQKPSGFGVVLDIVPHTFNRYTQRYLKSKGKENIEFQRKVESVMLRWGHFDVMGDESSDKHGDYPYDVFMAGGGMMRGQLVHPLLIRFYTYVDKDMYFDNQKEREEKMLSEYYHWKNEGYYDPEKP